MITCDTEKFTADEAIAIGLYDAIKRGETKFSVRYECGKSGVLEFKQNALVFTYKSGNMRVKKFKDSDESLKFIEYIKSYEGESK